MGKFWSTWAALVFAALSAAAARAEVVTDLAPFTWDSTRPEVLVLDGEITRRTPPLLGLALGRFETVEVIELSSLGGDAYAAMAMVPTIRAAGLATRIRAGDKCHSACSFLYFAGIERSAAGELGVHQLASANEASGHFIMNDVLDVFSDLGVPDTVRRRMMQTPPGEMYVFSPPELTALGLVGPAAAPAAPGTSARPAAVAEPTPGAAQREQAPTAKAPAYPDHEEIFVNDYAELIDAAAEDRVRQRLKDLGRVQGVQATVLTIASRDAYNAAGSLEAFATGLFNSWGIGDAARNDGILILVVRDDREMRIELGSGYPTGYDAVARDIIDVDFLPAFGAGQFSQGIERGVTAVIEKIALPARRGATAPPDPVPANTRDTPATHIALEIAGEANGRVVIELFDELASQNAARLARLTREGAYDGVVFHRVVDGFMAQTGDVEFGKAGGDLARAGTGGSSYPDLAAEFSDEPFVAGTVGMARAADPDSANAQFFIMFAPAPHLAGNYTVVGQVVEGLDVVQAIKRGSGSNGAVTEPDRIVRAVALASDGTPLPGTTAVSTNKAAEPRAGFEVRFDFTEQARVTLSIGWTLPPDLVSFVDCEDGESTALANGMTACVMSYSEPEARLLAGGPSGGLQLSATDGGGRTFTIDMLQFLAEVSPTPEEAVKMADTRFSIVVAATRIVETTGGTGADAATATLDLTLRQIVQDPDTIPAAFTTRFF